MGRRRGVVVFRDADPIPPRILKGVWSLGAAFDRTPHSYPIYTWAEMTRKLNELRDRGILVREIHVWSHGSPHGPFLGGTRRSNGRWRAGSKPTRQDLRNILAAAPTLQLIWWRACDVGRAFGFLDDLQIAMPGVTSVQHCEVISGPVRIGPLLIPRPWWQPAGCALRPHENPWWHARGDGLPGCFATRMTVPRKFYRR